MSKFRNLFQTLNSPRVVLGSGFMIGFVYDLKFNERTLEYPLSSIFNASIGGFITYLGAAIVHDFIPWRLRFIVPLTAGASCIYYKYKDFNENKKKD